MKREKQFGGGLREFLTDEEMANIAELQNGHLDDTALEVVDLLREGFLTLSDTQRQVILTLVDFDCTERKAAKILGLQYGTFIEHLKRARKKLKKYVLQNLKGSIYSAGLLKEMNESEAEESNTSTTNDTDENN